MLNVGPDAWGKGLGWRLLRAATAPLRAIVFTQAVLWVRPENSRARRVYEAAGWWPDGTEFDGVIWDVAVHDVGYRTTLGDHPVLPAAAPARLRTVALPLADGPGGSREGHRASVHQGQSEHQGADSDPARARRGRPGPMVRHDYRRTSATLVACRRSHPESFGTTPERCSTASRPVKPSRSPWRVARSRSSSRSHDARAGSHATSSRCESSLTRRTRFWATSFAGLRPIRLTTCHSCESGACRHHGVHCT